MRSRGPLVTDNRPFVHEVSWRDFELLPAKTRFVDQLYASSWIKVFTILVFGAISVAVMAFITNLGLSTVILMGAAGYVLAGGLAWRLGP